MFHSSTIELSESALRKNIRFLRSYIGPDTIFSSVIKGNAYGHGINVFVPLAEKCGVRHFSVFSADEAHKALQARGRDSHIMIMGHVDGDALEWAVANGLSFYAFDLDRLQQALWVARKVGKPARVHLELETGLHRTGLEGESLRRAVALVRDNPDAVTVEGACTHYAGAESVGNYLRIKQQIASFGEQCDGLQGEGLPIVRHSACSAAALTYPETIGDMVRFGIAQYGFWSSQETRMYYYLHNMPEDGRRVQDPLRRVMRWKSRVMSIKEVPPGEFVGYGTSYITTRKQRIAGVPVGYFHGFARSLSNLGHVLVRGRRAPVVGYVNMNMMMIDVTDVPGAAKGDEVVIIGKQKKMNISVASFSDLTRYLNYEVLVRLPAEIPRVVVK
jgi:alanine racemase